MPTYAYACTACGHRFEVQQSFSDASLTACPECEGRLRKLFNTVGIVFKGSGFYRTDSRPSANGSSNGSSDGSSESASKPVETSSASSGSSDSSKPSGSKGHSSGSSGAKPSAPSAPAA